MNLDGFSNLIQEQHIQANDAILQLLWQDYKEVVKLFGYHSAEAKRILIKINSLKPKKTA
ncbi:hypothetical protein JOC55_002214 [Paenibacillus sacheonensis]|nr:hypothetical protein [Paenibacillus sacheonensis]